MNYFNKNEFSKVLTKIYKSYHNQRQFAKVANVNRTYISKYINKKVDMPPSAKILRRLAKASKGITDYQQLMKICGYLEENEEINTSQYKSKLEQILELAEGLNINEANFLIKKLTNSTIQIEGR